MKIGTRIETPEGELLFEKNEGGGFAWDGLGDSYQEDHYFVQFALKYGVVKEPWPGVEDVAHLRRVIQDFLTGPFALAEKSDAELIALVEQTKEKKS